MLTYELKLKKVSTLWQGSGVFFSLDSLAEVMFCEAAAYSTSLPPLSLRIGGRSAVMPSDLVSH